MNTDKRAKYEFDTEYLAGWTVGHRAGTLRITSIENPSRRQAWLDGFDDARSGKVDAIKALGKDLLP